VQLAIEKEDFKQRLGFVTRLKPTNMATAMYLNKINLNNYYNEHTFI